MTNTHGTFTLESPDVGGQATPTQFHNDGGCTGHNISPALRWHHPPAGTQSFAITMYDPDAPTGSGFWHWVLFNLPANLTELPTGAGNPHGTLPEGAMHVRNDYGYPGYGGPCPPVGDRPHAYILTVHALDVPTLDLSPDTSPARVGFNINAHAIAKASIVFYAERKE